MPDIKLPPAHCDDGLRIAQTEA